MQAVPPVGSAERSSWRARSVGPRWPPAQVPVPPLTGHVIDQTGTLTAEQKATLEQTLTAFEARKGSQLAVLMIASSAPVPLTLTLSLAKSR